MINYNRDIMGVYITINVNIKNSKSITMLPDFRDERKEGRALRNRGVSDTF